MRVSIVIPAYNCQSFLGETVATVLQQPISDWELVIVDDGSSDATGAVAGALAEQDRRVHVVNQPNAGMAEARNLGLRETDARGAYVAFLDHDDLWHSHTLEALLQALEAHPQAVAAHGLARYIDGRSRPVAVGQLESWGRQRWGVIDNHLTSWPRCQPTSFAVLAYSNCIATIGALLIRRAALDRVGPLDPRAAPSDDWDLYLRLSRLGDIAFVDRVLVDWRAHANNASHARALVARKHRYVRMKLLSAPDLSEDQRRAAWTANRLWRRNVRAGWLLLARGSLVRKRPGTALRQLVRGLAASEWALAGK